MSEVVVRQVTEQDDLAALAELTVHAYDTAGVLDPEGEYVRSLLDTHGRFADALMLVAERAGSPLGTVCVAMPGSRWAEIAQTEELEFRMLAVDPAAQRQGVGAALVAAVIELARALGQQRVVLSVMDRNEVGHRLYRRLGFQRVVERDWSPVPGVELHVYTLGL